MSEELLRVENSLLLIQYKLRFFPSEYGPELLMLSERRTLIMTRMGGGCMDD